MYGKNIPKIALLFLIATIIGINGSTAEQGNQSVPITVSVSYDIAQDVTPKENIFTSTGASLAWTNTGLRNNRVYYGLNEADVNNRVNGSWSTWDNNTLVPAVRVTGLRANATYYYKPQVWYRGVATDLPTGSFVTLKPGVWVSPAEVQVSPAGWVATPGVIRTVNITAAPLDNNGTYVPGLSLEAIVYDITNTEIARIVLNGNGPYYADYIVPDYLKEGAYYVTIPGYSNVAGEFSVMNRACANCHVGGVSTFVPTNVHPRHTSTDDIHISAGSHYGNEYDITSTSQCDDCHGASVPSWVTHVPPTTCTNCHKSAELTCTNCHNDKTRDESVLSQRYGMDIHNGKNCEDCHSGLGSINNKPLCNSCHPLTGSPLTAVPDSITNKTHSTQDTVACGLCHNSIHDVKDLATETATCRNCHPGITHDTGRECTTCHGSDIHEIVSAGDTCIECHGTNYPGANPSVDNTFVNISAFNESIHQNINDRVNKDYRITNEDCWQCHYNKDMDRANIKGCNDCHRRLDLWHGGANITTNLSHLW